jgi:hypothetical protein
MATLTTNIVCAATNPPNVNLIWPQDGMQISGTSFTLQGQVDAPTTIRAAALAGDDPVTAGAGRPGNLEGGL